MLQLPNVLEIQQLLLRVPALIDRFAQHDPLFPDAINAWLREAETVLLANRLPAVSTVAALRGLLLGAARGIVPSVLGFHGKPTLRKVKEAAALEAVRQAQAVITAAIAADVAQLDEGRRLALQLVTLARAKGLVTAASSADPTAMLQALWAAMAADADLANAVLRLTGLVGANNGLALIDLALPNSA